MQVIKGHQKIKERVSDGINIWTVRFQDVMIGRVLKIGVDGRKVPELLVRRGCGGNREDANEKAITIQR